MKSNRFRNNNYYDTFKLVLKPYSIIFNDSRRDYDCMIKKRLFLIIAFIALIALITMPVQAWNQLFYRDYENLSMDSGDYFANTLLSHNGRGDISDITWIKEEVKTYRYAQMAATGTGSFDLQYGAYIVSNGTFDWTCDGADATNQNCTINAYLTNKQNLAQIPVGDAAFSLINIAGSGTHNPFCGEYHCITPQWAIGSYETGAYSVIFGIHGAGNKPNWGQITTYGGSNVVTPESAFSCTPTSQYPDMSVVCTDSSTNTPTDWYWTIDMEALGVDNWQTSTSRNFTWESHYTGKFSVNLRANNSAGSDWENKTNYVTIGNSTTGYISTNISITVQNVVGNTPIEGALVDVLYIPAGFQGTTNNLGVVDMIYAPHTENQQFEITVFKSGYVTKTEYFNVPNVPDYSYLIQLTPITSPTSTPITYDTLGLTATPDSINLGQSVSLVGSSSNATRLTYAGGLRRTIFMVNPHAQTYPFDFTEIGMFENVNATYWKFRTNYSATWSAPTTASPLTITHTPTTNGVYTYAFIGYETIAGGSGAIATAGTDLVTVNGGAGAGSLKMILTAMDGKTTAHLMNYQMNITDDSSGIVTEFGNVPYEKELSLPRGNSYTLRASKENYEEGSKQFIVPVSPAIVDGTYGAIAVVNLYPSGWITVGNTSVAVRAYDAETYYPLSSVQISITGYPIQYTGEDGASASFSIPQNTAYTVVASKSGYCAVTESKNTGTEGYQLVSMFMKYGACTGTTPTPTPTPTPSVTVTPIGGYGNLTGETMVCGVMPDDATIIDVLKNSLACNGLETKESQNLGLAMLIMLFAAIILGRVAKGIGVLAGVIAGAVVSMAMGFLPFWIIIVVIIIAGLVFASKIFWSSGGQ